LVKHIGNNMGNNMLNNGGKIWETIWEIIWKMLLQKTWENMENHSVKKNISERIGGIIW